MSSINDLLAHAERHCSSQGKRLTVKRKQVLSILLSASKPLSVYELIDFAREKYHVNLQAMSAYRMLEFLEEEHLVHRLNVSNKYVACAHIHRDCEHGITQFLICCKCDKIVEQTIHPSMITNLESNAEQEGFTVVNPQLEINCVCDQCAADVGK
ncbi:Fur family transcriptional regulator [Vibrio maritimus]|uniref:Fur family transcriptional regulator n=1 Tax=Vibrio maritimus TaxID=990268 RepID=UPI0040691CF8